MNFDFILYIIMVMIFWDFSCHVIELFGWVGKFLESNNIFSYYYPHFRYKKTPNGLVERKNWQKLYQRFWVTFWGLAFILIVVHIVIK
ncbi:MAG: hypothetical protein NTY04_01175 [Candidatus Staskawiczbacteria bacterium]|nr:hypothetical protein [Candidatus Staskawiczbacteria bacterium]